MNIVHLLIISLLLISGNVIANSASNVSKISVLELKFPDVSNEYRPNIRFASLKMPRKIGEAVFSGASMEYCDESNNQSMEIPLRTLDEPWFEEWEKDNKFIYLWLNMDKELLDGRYCIVVLYAELIENSPIKYTTEKVALKPNKSLKDAP